MAIDNARAQLEHQATRVTNLELGLKHALPRRGEPETRGRRRR